MPQPQTPKPVTPATNAPFELRAAAAIKIAKDFMAHASAAERIAFLQALQAGAQGRSFAANAAINALARQFGAARASGVTYASARAAEMDRAMGCAVPLPAIEHNGNTTVFRTPTRGAR